MSIVYSNSRDNGNMPEIDRLLFQGTEQLTPEDWRSVETPDLSSRSVGQVLMRHGWNGKGAAAAVAVKLQPDNTSPETARLVLLGEWEGAIKIQAKKLFTGADSDTLLEIKLPDLAVFRFVDDQLCSRYTPQEAVPYQFTQGEKILADEEDRMAQGIGDFSLRVVAGLSKTCGVKYGLWLHISVLLFHLTAENMEDREVMPLGGHPAWPGIKLVEGQIPILPGAGKKKPLFGGKDWGAPISPIVAPGVPWEAAPGPPEQQEIIEACRQLLNTGTMADTAATADAVTKKWDRPQITDRPAEKEWPSRPMAKEKPKGKKGKNRIMNRMDGILILDSRPQ